VLRVRDYGIGLDGGPAGAGIRGMRERALLVGADLSIRSAAGGGTEVALSLPLRGER
jgi:two-component system sensor histidine kinase UhpB